MYVSGKITNAALATMDNYILPDVMLFSIISNNFTPMLNST